MQNKTVNAIKAAVAIVIGLISISLSIFGHTVGTETWVINSVDFTLSIGSDWLTTLFFVAVTWIAWSNAEGYIKWYKNS